MGRWDDGTSRPTIKLCAKRTLPFTFHFSLFTFHFSPFTYLLLRPDAGEVDYHVHRLVHRRQRRILVAAVEVHAAREEVGTGQTHEREA